MKREIVFFCVMLLFMVAKSQTNCYTNKIILNTGRNPSTGTLRPIGQQDSLWQVISILNTNGQSGFSLPYSPFVVSPYGTWWYPTNSRFLNKVNTVNETGGPLNTSIVISRHFTTVQDDSFRVKAFFCVDNFVTSFEIDGINYFTSPSVSSWSNFQSQNLAIDDTIIFLEAGCHDISATYGNEYPSFGNNPTGINIEGYIESKNNDSTLIKETCYTSTPPTLIANNVLNYCSDCRLISPNLQINSGFGCGNLLTAKVYFLSGYTQGQDTLQVVSQLGVTSNFNSSTGVLTLSGNVNYSVWETVLRTVCYKSLVPTINNNSNTKNIVISLGDALYNSNNGHYYKLKNNGSPITWQNARNAAASTNYFGLQGYLVTITDSSESSFIVSLIQSNTWMGANDSLLEGTWRWVTGCEGLENAGLGRVFSGQVGNCGSVAGTGTSINNNFINWDFFEPNDIGCNEDYAHLFANGLWNDLANSPPAGYQVPSYIIEYGCMPNDPIIQISGNVIVHLIDDIDTIINYSICQGQSYQGYSNSGTYIDTFQSSSGCDSIRTLYLLVNPNTFTLSTNTSCDSYTWPLNGVTYTTSGIYIASSTNSNGCPHTDSLFLTINNNTSSSSIQTSCNSYTWSVNNQTYYSSGIYTVTSTNANGCLHTDSLLLTINNVTSSSSTVVACDSYTWPTNNQTYTSSGIYTSITMNTNGCTQTDSLILTINYSTTTSTSQTACNSFTWPPNNQTYSTGGIYIASSTNTSGCPHTDSLILTVNNSTSTATTQTACDSFFWSVSGLNYTSSGNYVVTSMNTNNCAHTDSLFLTIHASSSSSQNAIACDSLLWNGINYSLSGNYNALFANIYGCDSLAVLNLTVNYSTYSIDTLTACDSTFWQGSYYFNSGVYYDTLLNALGCDSILQLNLTIQNSTSDTTSEVACDSLLWNGNIYTTTGTYTGQFTNVAGCDSLHTLLLTINHSTTGSSVISNCDQYAWNQQTYTQSGTYSGLFINSSNCDSTHVLTLTILSSSTGTSDTIACDSLVWNGTLYTQSGTYTNLFTNAVGCDSTHSLLLEIHPSTSHSIDTSACDQFLWQVNQTEYQTSGNYEVISTDAYGCSHSEQLALTILESDSLHIHQNICTGETYHGYQTPGNYIETYINQYGCDSVVFIHLTSDVKSCCDHYFPNAFSPNGDGLNDEFSVLGEHDYESYELEIYSRWGQLLFTTKNSEIGWDGKWKMEPCDMGTYFYLAKIKCSGKKEIIEKGDLILVR